MLTMLFGDNIRRTYQLTEETPGLFINMLLRLRDDGATLVTLITYAPTLPAPSRAMNMMPLAAYNGYAKEGRWGL